MAKIMITLSAILMAVVCHSNAYPSLTPDQNPYPIPTDGKSADCNAVLNAAHTTCTQTGIEAVNKSGFNKQILDAEVEGDLKKFEELQYKSMCCNLWTMLDCMDNEGKNKCDVSDYIVAHAKLENKKHTLATGQCKNVPETLKCK